MKSNEETKNQFNTLDIGLTNINLAKEDSDYIHLNKLKGVKDTKQIHEKLNLHKRSITPDTLKEIVFEESEQGLYYKEYYDYNGNKVTRLAINYSNIKADLDRKKILGESTDLIDTTQKAEKSVKSSQYKLEDAEKVVHHSLEVKLIQQAISQLLDRADKTILVDIFARENGAVKVLKDYIPETHTVVLYKNPAKEEKHEIWVIDPSNFLFSSHLFNLNGIVKHELLSKITTLHKGLQIYTPIKDNTGPYPDQYRDCIDIAEKLAFGLNKIKASTIDIKDIKNHDVIKMISNEPDIDGDIIFKNIPVRIKQASDIKQVEKFNNIEKVMSKNIQMTKKFHIKLTDFIKNAYKEIINTEHDYSKIEQKLLNLNQEYISVLSSELNSEQLKLLGGDTIYEE